MNSAVNLTEPEFLTSCSQGGDEARLQREVQEPSPLPFRCGPGRSAVGDRRQRTAGGL